MPSWTQSLYDWVHSGSTQLFMDPDKTEANFNRAESSCRREEGRVDSTKLLGAGGRLCWRHIQRWDISNKKQKKLAPRECSGQNPTEKYAPSAERRRTIYYRESHSGTLVRKNAKFLWFYKGNIVTSITGNTFSGQGMMFGTFLMKNIFIDFPTPILKHIFCYIWWKNSCFLQANLIVMWEYIMGIQIKPMKSIGFFDEIMHKICFKKGVRKSVKIFFIRNVPNIIPWLLKVLPAMLVTMFPL